jgi:hypothetical protein
MSDELGRYQQTPLQRFAMVVGVTAGIILLGDGIEGMGTLRTDTAARWGNIVVGALLLILAIYQFVKYLRNKRRTVGET